MYTKNTEALKAAKKKKATVCLFVLKNGTDEVSTYPSVLCSTGVVLPLRRPPQILTSYNFDGNNAQREAF